MTPAAQQRSAASGDALLRNKKHAELLQSYEARRDAAAGFLLRVRPGLAVRTGALLDPNVSPITEQ